MKKYNNILVVAEPKRDVQLALMRALEISQFNPKAVITLLRVVYDFSYDLFIRNKAREKPVQEDIEQTYIDSLEKTINEYRLKTNSESTVHAKVIASKDVAEGIVREIQTGKYDLIVKAANHHGVLDSIIFTPIDWYILRNSQIPVIIAKEHGFTEGGNIVVCVDFTLKDHVASNIAMLREAQIVAKLTKSSIHLVNSAPVYLPSVMLEVPHYSPSLYEQNVVEEHKNRLFEFASKHHIAKENCHIQEGMPDEVIPQLCQKLKPSFVFIGSACRSGVMAAIIGNTCEEIVDDIDADLFVLNRKTISK
ncbi:MAG: universal stress protein UspE [Succinivibrio sp.]